MVLEQIYKSLTESLAYMDRIQIVGEELIVLDSFGINGLHTCITLPDNNRCMFRYPVVLYENSNHSALLLSSCKDNVSDFDVSFQNDLSKKCIWAIEMQSIQDENCFLRSVGENLTAFVYYVKSIRDALVDVVLESISPVCLDCTERALFYLSLIQHPIKGLSQSGMMPIDWTDIRTIWKRSKSVVLIPKIRCLEPESLFENISAQIKQFLGKEPGTVLAYYGFPSSADTSELQIILGIRDWLYSKYGCNILYGFHTNRLSGEPYTVRMAIFRT